MIADLIADLWAQLIPQALSGWSMAVLLASSLVTSFITAAFGAGGGVLLLGIMTVYLPVTAVIPLHGVIQAGSNAGRVALGLRDIRWPIVLAFAGGGIIGALAGSQLLVRLPLGWMELALGAFILWACWGPKPTLRRGSGARVAAGGAITSLVTLFVGATGPFVAAMLRAMRLDRHVHVSTFSACMVIQHGLKIGVFGLLGFAFAPYLPFLAAMLIAGFAGTVTGRIALEDLSNRGFHTALNVILTVLALRLLYSGTASLLGG
ncbi:TSUP family transporter [Aquisalimonas sp.]|uniref:TSUP family transporter n=1 Tax=unclassified Aquisalimonas TaxID=2644645 RepID=UPI0025C6CECB|nr:TSUP family transporter [Aquisalimonas sp.]